MEHYYFRHGCHAMRAMPLCLIFSFLIEFLFFIFSDILYYASLLFLSSFTYFSLFIIHEMRCFLPHQIIYALPSSEPIFSTYFLPSLSLQVHCSFLETRADEIFFLFLPSLLSSFCIYYIFSFLLLFFLPPPLLLLRSEHIFRGFLICLRAGMPHFLPSSSLSPQLTTCHCLLQSMTAFSASPSSSSHIFSSLLPYRDRHENFPSSIYKALLSVAGTLYLFFPLNGNGGRVV